MDAKVPPIRINSVATTSADWNGVFSTDDSRCRSIKGREKFSSVDEDDVIEIDYLLGGCSIVLWTLSLLCRVVFRCRMMLFLGHFLSTGSAVMNYPTTKRRAARSVGLSLLSAQHAYDDGVLVTLLIFDSLILDLWIRFLLILSVRFMCE
jgi:hypothetical protein